MTRKYGSIQLLRYLAAVAVIAFHQTGAFISINKLNTGNLFSWGSRGVDLFFVISGFVIANSYSLKPVNAKIFAINRLARIVPSYWLMTAAAIGIGLFANVGGAPAGSPATLLGWKLASLLFASQPLGFSNPVLYQGWSLEYEMFFYLIFTIGIAFGLRAEKLIVAAGVAVIVSTLIPGFSIRAIGFVFGMILAVLHARLQHNNSTRIVAAVGCLVAFLIGNSVIDAATDVAYLGGFALLILFLLQSIDMRREWVLRLGSASYPIYLLQWFTVPTVTRIFHMVAPGAGAGLLAMYLAVSILVTTLAGLAWDNYIDRPLAGWTKKKLLAITSKR